MNCFEDEILVIEGTSYNITPIPAMRGLSFMRRLTKLLGAPMAAMFGQEESETEGENSIQKAVLLLVENMDKEDVEALIVDLMKTVTKDGQALNFNIEFTKDYGKLFKILTEVVKVNFGSLFQLGAIGE